MHLSFQAGAGDSFVAVRVVQYYESKFISIRTLRATGCSSASEWTWAPGLPDPFSLRTKIPHQIPERLLERVLLLPTRKIRDVVRPHCLR